METISLDGESMMSAMAAAYVHRLRERGASYEESVRMSERAAGTMADSIGSLMRRASESIYTLYANGVRSQKVFDTNAIAVFSVAGVSLADEMFKSLISERN